MVKTLGELQPRGAGTRRSWYDWSEKPETISLLTGLAVIQMLGPEATMELLFGEMTSADQRELAAGSANRLDHLQTAITEAITEMAHLRERVEGFVVPELAKQGELMSKMLADSNSAGVDSASDVKRAATRRSARTVDG